MKKYENYVSNLKVLSSARNEDLSFVHQNDKIEIAGRRIANFSSHNTRTNHEIRSLTMRATLDFSSLCRKVCKFGNYQLPNWKNA